MIHGGDCAGFYSRAIGYGAGNKVRGNTDCSNGWHYIVGVSDGNLWSVYVDGNLDSLTIIGGVNNGEWFDEFAGDTYSIGVLNYPGFYGLYNGNLDEVRESVTIRNGSWILTTFNNQNDPAGFMFIGPEEPGS